MSTRGRVRSSVRAAVVGAVALLLVAGLTGCQRPPAKDRPVLLIHGWSAGGGTDCGSTFDRTISALRAEGFTGPFIKVGFYTGDKNCTMTLRDWGRFDNGSSWKEVAKAFSSYVYETYTRNGTAVDVVGHSMGGLIARGAVQGSAAGESGFAPPLRVEDAVTLGTPHEGAAWYTSLCLWGQCSTLKPGAADLTWLARNGNPQGVGGTEWTVQGSGKDEVVPAASALAMDLPAERKVRWNGIVHSDSGSYNTDVTVLARTARALAEAGV